MNARILSLLTVPLTYWIDKTGDPNYVSSQMSSNVIGLVVIAVIYATLVFF
jgi:hypothetical protein